MSFSEQFFDVELPSILADHADFTKGTNYRLKVVIRNVGGWLIDFHKVPVTVTKTEEWGDAQLEIDDADFEALIQDPNKYPSFYFGGKVRLKGETPLFADFYRWISLKKKT